MLKKFSVGGWCGRVIIVSALSERKRVKRERELDNLNFNKDCTDGSDELDCNDDVVCGSDHLQCHDRTCIDSRRRCDGYSDCSGGRKLQLFFSLLIGWLIQFEAP